MDVKNLIDKIFPRQCINCSAAGAYLCKECKKNLIPHPEICPYCHRCSQDYKTCIPCKTDKNSYLEGIIIPFAYTTLLKRLILKLKYFHKKDISGFLVERLALVLQANKNFQQAFENCLVLEGEKLEIKNSKLFISFVPSHRYRHYFIKGYNQSEVLAKKLSEYLNIPYIQIMKKKKHTKTQASLKKEGRLKNLKNVFCLTDNLHIQGNETILIIDDITTTGTTINELAKIIKSTYPQIKVRGAVLGRHM